MEMGLSLVSKEPTPKLSPGRNTVRMGNSKEISVPVGFFTRLFLALISGALLITPLTILSFRSTRKAYLTTIAVFTVISSLLVSLISKSTNSEIMAASAGTINNCGNNNIFWDLLFLQGELDTVENEKICVFENSSLPLDMFSHTVPMRVFMAVFTVKP